MYIKYSNQTVIINNETFAEPIVKFTKKSKNRLRKTQKTINDQRLELKNKNSRWKQNSLNKNQIGKSNSCKNDDIVKQAGIEIIEIADDKLRNTKYDSKQEKDVTYVIKGKSNDEDQPGNQNVNAVLEIQQKQDNKMKSHNENRISETQIPVNTNNDADDNSHRIKPVFTIGTGVTHDKISLTPNEQLPESVNKIKKLPNDKKKKLFQVLRKNKGIFSDEPACIKAYKDRKVRDNRTGDERIL